MIDALIGGRLQGHASKKTGNSGKPYVVVRVRTATNGGDNLIVNVITFNHDVGVALLALRDGDSVCLSGALTPKVWQPANGEPRVTVDLVAHAISSVYHVQRKRQAVQSREDSGKLGAYQRAMSPLPQFSFDDL